MNARAWSVRVARIGIAAICAGGALTMLPALAHAQTCVAGLVCLGPTPTPAAASAATPTPLVQLPAISPTLVPVCLPGVTCATPTVPLSTPALPGIGGAPAPSSPAGGGSTPGGGSSPGGGPGGATGTAAPGAVGVPLPSPAAGSSSTNGSAPVLNLAPPPAVPQLGAVSGALSFGKAPFLWPVLIILDIAAFGAAAIVVRRTVAAARRDRP